MIHKTSGLRRSLWEVAHVYVDDHPITLVPVNGGRHHDKRVLGDEIPYTPLILAVLGLEVEFEGGNRGNEEN
jgi:hypothetical protein